MHPSLAPLAGGIHVTGDIPADVTAFLTRHGCPRTIEHSREVAEEARCLAIRFGAGPAQAEAAGWLHDVSAVIPNGERVRAARDLGLAILPEEQKAPVTLHQKLSAAMAAQLFGLDDQAVLSAIACHTTLKAGASTLDKVLFIADKVRWDQPHQAPYLQAVLAGLEHSLNEGVRAYLEYLWQRRETLAAVHPWLAEAHAELAQRPGAGE
jgi:predicted HD superfamily hydrolase involved in NAD metabolism